MEEDPNYNPLPEDRPGGFDWGAGAPPRPPQQDDEQQQQPQQAEEPQPAQQRLNDNDRHEHND